MKSILEISQLSWLSQKLKREHKKIVLVGGCFDVIHPGHIIFLEKAKRAGDILIVLLESDQKIKLLKGINRPFFTQLDRVEVLSSIKFVDFVVLLPFISKDKEYDQLILKIKPDIIAATKNSSGNKHPIRAAKLVGAQLKYVTKIVGNYSTSRILNK